MSKNASYGCVCVSTILLCCGWKCFPLNSLSLWMVLIGDQWWNFSQPWILGGRTFWYKILLWLCDVKYNHVGSVKSTNAREVLKKCSLWSEFMMSNESSLLTWCFHHLFFDLWSHSLPFGWLLKSPSSDGRLLNLIVEKGVENMKINWEWKVRLS